MNTQKKMDEIYEDKTEHIETIYFVDDEYDSHTTIIGAILNSLNLITGTSFVGIPYAMKQSGLVAGLVILVILCWLTGKRYLTYSLFHNFLMIMLGFDFFCHV